MDTNTVDNIRQFLELLGEAILVLVPIAAVIYYKVVKAWKEKKASLKLKDREVAEQELLNYSHTESMTSMENLRGICNLFFDRTHADRVAYYQLENGTMADSKLQNMFISCMAESDRYSTLPARVSHVQRCPVQSVVSHIEAVNKAAFIEYVKDFDGYNHLDPRVKDILYARDASAIRIVTVHNTAGYITGYVIFEYLFDELGIDGFKADECPNSLIRECAAAVESELLRYTTLVATKKSELGL